jgi:hypothetical protein
MNKTERFFVTALILTALLALLSVPDVQAGVTAQESKNMATPDLIRQALEIRQIDTDTANLYLAYALGDYEKLPQEYRSDVAWEGTLTLLDLGEALRTGSAGRFRSEIAAILTPRGSCSSSTASLPNVSNSAHFHIEYGTIGGGLNLSNYATSLETAWSKQVAQFGWSAPPVLGGNPPPSNLYHVRIDNLGGGLYGFVSNSGVHAGFVGNNPNTAWNDVDAYATCMVLNNDYSGFPGSPQQALDSTTAHEFNHSIQFGLGALTGSNRPTIVFIEGGATWMEDEVYDAANDNYNYLWPNFSMAMGNYTSSPYPYWITFRGLTERYGTGVAGAGEQVIQDFWETLSKGTSGDGIVALNTALGMRGTNLNDAFHAYAIAVKFNKTCGGSFVYPYCFEEAVGYVGNAGATPLNGSILSVGNNYVGSIADSYAINWIRLPTGSSNYRVTLQNTSGGGALRGSIVCETGSALNITPLPSVVGSGASASINSFNPSGCTSVVAVITNQSTATASTSRSYQLSTGAPINPNWFIRGVDDLVHGTGTDIPVPADYNGDGKDDVAIFRESNSTWYIYGVSPFTYGTTNDIPVIADYNGDGKDDIAVFRESNSTWYIYGVGPSIYGTTNDIPVVADYNGDGKADIAVFRESNSTWYLRGIGPSIYGTTNDIPVVGDYNGDGKADIAVFRPSTSTWYIRGIGNFQFGTSGDIPVVGDYNGDGKDDIAVFRPSNGTWYIRGIGNFVHGQNGDIPVPADYNGDGITDAAVFRP